MPRAALISVSDRTGLVDLAKALQHSGYTLLATSGSAKYLKEAGIETLAVEQYTQQREILDGRVKTLHPKIYAGLLAKRDKPEHMQELEREGIMAIDLAIINLYPFIEHLNTAEAKNPERMVELIDIGGPSMIRAAAKNHQFVVPLIDPQDYAKVITLLKEDRLFSQGSSDFRRQLALKVFSAVANYNLAIAKYFSNVTYSDSGQKSVDDSAQFELGEVTGQVLIKSQSLRYGENPHQAGGFYHDYSKSTPAWEQLSGKELSYNNILDCDAALKLLQGFDTPQPFVGIIKHLNPCGAALAATVDQAFLNAKRGDTRSYFGGIIACNSKVTKTMAEEIRKDFFEIIIAPQYEDTALEALKSSKNLRIMRVMPSMPGRYESRAVQGGFLVQEVDRAVSDVRLAQVVSKRAPSAVELSNLELAWKLCAHVKSNAIVLVRDNMLVGTGGGQMSRIDSVEIALSKAKAHGHELSSEKPAVAASDAFFPFADSIEMMARSGISAVIAPQGAKRDDDVIKAADLAGIGLLFTADRHFRH